MAANKKASNSEILKQVACEMLFLAYLVEIMGKNKCFKGQSSIESNDAICSFIAVKFRILYDFLYGMKNTTADARSIDDYTAKDDFNMTLKKPIFSGLDPNGMFTSDAVDKFTVRLTYERTLKPKNVPLPRFKGGSETYVINSALILASAEKFIDAMEKNNFMNLNQESENCLKDFKKAVERLKENPLFKASYK